MAVEFRREISSEITETGIYYATMNISRVIDPNTGKKIVFEEKIVFSRYMEDRDIERFWKNHKVTEFGVKEKSPVKQVIHIKISPIKFLGNVNSDTYNRWKISKENTKNSSTT